MARKPVLTRPPDRIRTGAGGGQEQEETEPDDGDDVDGKEPTVEPVGMDLEPDVAADIDVDADVPRDTPLDAADDIDAVDEDAAIGAGTQRSLDKLINTIPGEVLVLWAALEGAADLYGLPLWAYGAFLVLTAVATPVYVYRSIERPDGSSTEPVDPSDPWWQEANVRWQALSATGAFLVWVYYLGGPFQAAGVQEPALATSLVLIYPVLIVISPYYGSLLLYFLSNSNRQADQESAAG